VLLHIHTCNQRRYILCLYFVSAMTHSQKQTCFTSHKRSFAADRGTNSLLCSNAISNTGIVSSFNQSLQTTFVCDNNACISNNQPQRYELMFHSSQILKSLAIFVNKIQQTLTVNGWSMVNDHWFFSYYFFHQYVCYVSFFYSFYCHRHSVVSFLAHLSAFHSGRDSLG